MITDWQDKPCLTYYVHVRTFKFWDLGEEKVNKHKGVGVIYDE